MNRYEKYEAVIKNDGQQDGKFFYAVKSTGVYCRPSCKSKTPSRENVEFFKSDVEAEAAGYRPCKKCRPDLLNYDPTGELAEKVRGLIEKEYSESSKLTSALYDVGVTRRHLNEIFKQKFDMSIREYTRKVRLERAKELLDGDYTITDIAFTIGFENSASFNKFFKQATGISPSEYRKKGEPPTMHTLYGSPLGEIYIAARKEGIVQIQFVDMLDIEMSDPAAGPKETRDILKSAKKQLDEYFKGHRKEFDLPLAPGGTEFQKKVWHEIAKIPYGKTRNYDKVAAKIGNEKAARAVGQASNRNPILIVIPCHRVVGKDGGLRGYAGGLARKQRLLDLEQIDF